ncbi:MAG TPA: ABC transporter permease, partial [Blastocatellia bacterium]|nr:ABC transporter permease [Blastocatellia bacterium]
WRWLDSLVGDVRYSIRSLSKSLTFTLGAGAVLALAIGANLAIFSVVNTVLLQPLAYPDAERIVSVETFWTNTGRAGQDVSGPDFLDWQAQSNVFDAMAHYGGEEGVAIVVGDRAEFANDMYVSSDFFTVFGQTASAGRLFTDQDAPAGGASPTVAVVRRQWAESHFGVAEAAIGKTITHYGRPLRIVGVAARGFSYPGVTDIWLPWRTSSSNRSASDWRVVGKLKAGPEGVDLAQAKAQMQAIGDNLARQYPENQFKTVALIPLQDRLTGDVKIMLWVLLGAVIVVLLIACANIANLQLARSAARTREIALRAALGAGRGRVMRQLLTENCVLMGLATCAGLILAAWLIRGLTALSPADLPRLDEVRIDRTVLLFAVGLSLSSTLLFGLAPAIHASRLDLSEALKRGGSKGATSGGGARLHAMFVVAEVALSVILLVAAGLLLRSFQALQRVDLGFTTERVLVAYTQYAVGSDEDRRNRTTFYADFLDRLRATPGVSSAAGVAFLPMGKEPRPARDYFIQGRPEGQLGERPKAELQAITPGFFKTLEIPIRAGRDFDRTDTLERPPVAVINETLARAAFPGESPLGRFIRRNSKAPWMEIIGVVTDIRWQDPSQPPQPVIFVSSAQGTGGSLSIFVRTSLDEKSIAGSLRTLLHDANPTVPVRFETMEELFSYALAYPRFRTRLIGAFAAMAMLLAAVGVFSLLAYLVGQQTKELAIRRALGAKTVDVLRLVVGQGLRLVVIGLAVGLAGAISIARLLEKLLFGISPWDFNAYLGAIAALGISAVLAILLPAIRAAAVDPLIALRHD